MVHVQHCTLVICGNNSSKRYFSIFGYAMTVLYDSKTCPGITFILRLCTAAKDHKNQ